MPTTFAHAAAGLGIASALRSGPMPRRYWVSAALCATIVDVDNVWSYRGPPYDAWLAHRGLTHSIAFAALLAFVVVLVAFRRSEWREKRRRIWASLALVTASHGFLDALTAYGPGVAFFIPFSSQRFFFLWRPLTTTAPPWATSTPIFLLVILAREFVWIWVPALMIAWLGARLRQNR